MAFVKNAAMQFQQLRLKKMQEQSEKPDNETDGNSDKEVAKKEDESLEAGEAKKLIESLTTDGNTKEIVKSAAEAVGSLSSTEFEVRFNSDVFQPHVQLADEEVRATAKVTEGMFAIFFNSKFSF